MTARRILANLAALSVLAITSQAAARTCTWRATSASTFQTASNWLCSFGSGPPVAGDTAVFTSSAVTNCTVSATSAVSALTVDSTYTGTIDMTSPLTVSGAMTVGGGTFTAASAALQVGSLSITGGNVTLSSGTTTVGGAFSNSGGTFSANGGTVTLSGSGALSPGSSSFNNLTINASGSTYTLGSTLLVGGNLTITAGTLAGGTNAISVSGNWSNSGTFTSSGTVTLTGTSSANTLKSNGSSFSALTINASGDTYTLQDKLTTTRDLTLTAGTLVASTFNVQVGGNMSVTSGSFTGGSGTVAVTSNLTMTGGTWTGGSGTETVGGNLTVSNSATSSDPTLVGYWKLDDTASPAVDSSGNGNNLTWSGTFSTTTTVPSAITFTDPRALAFTGTQSAASADLSGIAELRPTTVTLSAWYKATSVDTTAGEVVSGSNTYGLRITSTGAMVIKRITDNTATADWIEYRATIPSVLDGAWHHLVGVVVTGTGGGMSLYFDGGAYSGNYWVNGSSGASQLTAGTTPTASTAATAAIDWNANTETFGMTIGNNPSTTGYQFGKGCSAGACAIDDVRVYSRALTATDVAALARGSQPSSTTGALSLTGALTVSGSASIQSSGSLTLNSGSSLAVGSALTMDGKLTSTGGTIKGASTSYAFKVGSVSGATPTLNINGLTVKNTDTNGMWINANTGATTTFTRFDKVAFSNGTGTQLLQIYAPSLFLTANGCSFDNTATYAVKLTGNGTGSGAGPRAVFGNATCGTNDATTGLCATSQKSDDDANNDGVADHPTTNGAVVQFVRGGQSDTSGTIVGFPTAAFDWTTYAYYGTYVAFHDTAAGSDVIYVRDQSGNPLYSWTDPSPDETIVGTPRWITSGGSHYLYVAVNGASSNTGKVYRLKDSSTLTTSGTLTLDSTWATSGAYSCTCTVTSNLSMDATNLYWAATTSTSQVLMGITQSGGAKISTSWPVTTPNNVTTSAPTLVTTSGTTTLYLGITANLLQLAVTGTTFVQNTKPGTITGRVTYGVSGLTATLNTARVYAGDSGGTMWAISPTTFSGTNFLWSYPAGSALTDNTYDSGTDTLQFGTSGGKVVVLNAATAALYTGYPYTLDTTDPITAAPLYYAGVLVVGTTKGKLYFLDRNTGSGVSIIKTYSFGSGETISTVAFDVNSSRYMVSTSSSTASDGRLYSFDLVSDPTPSSK